MKYIGTLLFVFLFSFAAFAQSISATELLEKSIQYHDPKGIWGAEMHELFLRETRPGGADRTTTIRIDLNNSTFSIDQMRDGHQLFSEIKNEECRFQLDGNSEVSEEDLKKYRLNCERTGMLRNYYTYLWGLPMKLKDPGTIIDSKVTATDFEGQKSLALKVTYDEAVGKDIWYFYFHPETYALIGYRFYHDESKNDGEYITLEGEESLSSLRLPKTRKWYTHKENKFLGADILEKE